MKLIPKCRKFNFVKTNIYMGRYLMSILGRKVMTKRQGLSQWQTPQMTSTNHSTNPNWASARLSTSFGLRGTTSWPLLFMRFASKAYYKQVKGKQTLFLCLWWSLWFFSTRLIEKIEFFCLEIRFHRDLGSM